MRQTEFQLYSLISVQERADALLECEKRRVDEVRLLNDTHQKVSYWTSESEGIPIAVSLMFHDGQPKGVM